MSDQPAVLPTKIKPLQVAMNLTVLDRLNILGILPFIKQGKLLDMILIDKITERLGLTDDEEKEVGLQVKDVPAEDGSMGKTFFWNKEADKEKLIIFTKKEYALIDRAAQAVDAAGLVRRELVPTLQKILVIQEEEESE